MSDVALAEIDELIGMVEDVCLLLTLACGCRVNWLFYDVTDLSGASLRSHHRDAITKPFGTLRLISSEPPEDIASFLERSYPIYKSEFDRWELNKAIEAYNDAKIETDYLEFRALKLVVVMEHLRGRYAKEQGKVNVFPQETFDARLVVLKETVKKSVQQWLPEAAAAQIEMLTNSVEGMNWYPFRRAIKEMYCEVGLQVSSRDRGRFVDIRNELVHRMDFPGNRDSDWRHYQFLMNLIGKTLLAILRYDDFYLDWTTGATEPWRTEMQMRTKLELNGREGEGHSDDVQLG